MEIAEACRTLRQCNEAFCTDQQPTMSAAVVASAVGVVKAYLQRVRADGKSIHELDIPEHLAFTPEGMRWVMPFVISAEGMLAYSRRKQMS